MTYTSPTAINGTRGIVAILEYVNTVTNFWISRFLMIAIFVLFAVGYFRSSKNDDFIGSVAVGSYACLVIGLMFWITKFLDSLTFGIIIAVTLISTAVLLLDKRGQS